MKTYKPRQNVLVVGISINQPTFISTFCGTGGSSLGYKWAGFKELLAIDFNDHAVECFQLNFPDVPIWNRSIENVTGKEIMEYCNISLGQLDVLDGSPPCQGFSTAGKRNVRDPRNDLFTHYVRLITELNPKVFIMENVSGMAKGKMKGRFIEIMKTLKSLDYNVKCKQMNAMYYDVPQSRERLIFIGVRNDLAKEPQYPIPNQKTISVKEALGLDGYYRYRHDYSKGNVSFKEVSFNEPSKTITKTQSSEYFIKLLKSDSSHVRPFAKTARAIWENIKPGQTGSSYRKGYYNSAVKVDPNKPCPTIMKSLNGLGGHMHWFEKRSLTINEVKRLCSFPDDWILTGDTSKQWARLGNAVMPKFMKAIALNVKETILDT